ncbi:hypothetical protein [Okeania sp. SIO3B5]|nr:hypothetical protein [Okeania sp. SIO3B5]
MKKEEGRSKKEEGRKEEGRKEEGRRKKEEGRNDYLGFAEKVFFKE